MHEEPGNRALTRLAEVRARVDAAARGAGRDPAEVRVMLATKTQSVADVQPLVAAGARLLGENRVQELVAKGPELTGMGAEVHVIGHLQSNKVNAALRWAACVQSIDALDLAERLSRRCEAVGRDLDVMVQVNVSGEASKFGVPPAEAGGLAVRVAALPRLRLTGFMTIGARSSDRAEVRAGFARLRAVRDEVLGAGAPGTAEARELSMGMSGDLEDAVAEGATIVRVGTAVFGARPAP
ncbi:YggS family pyridoxal phosphate-dependent enzyme [Cellulomonas bogoriensis]|uniref:Pyridoxal phosphate homeostasis protein n=1 Tax=Cellulomonas bogoriensis 69B4 = DSM 16987 TaxID=1386082 RepID=A0A0A0C178_9CELL|nr:YggS family pyridoxal phosphate-dependent enzyme [Cellulomonas bogoriensis]KGM14393.1 alanine racemase [Cellulomonas bogoriensis 69B4 = DSM 16987]